MAATENTSNQPKEPEHAGDDRIWFRDGAPSRLMSPHDYRAWVRREVASQVLITASAVASVVGVAGIGLVYGFLSSQIESRVASLGSEVRALNNQVSTRVEFLERQVSTDVEALTAKLSNDIETQAHRTERQLEQQVQGDINEARTQIEVRLPSLVLETLAREEELAEKAVAEIVESIDTNKENTQVIVDAVRQKLKDSDEIQQVLLDRASEIAHSFGDRSDNVRRFALTQIILYAYDNERNDYLVPILMRPGDSGSTFELALTAFVPWNTPEKEDQESAILAASLEKMFATASTVRENPAIYVEFLSRFGRTHIPAITVRIAQQPDHAVVPVVLDALIGMQAPETVDYLVRWLGEQGNPTLVSLAWRGLSSLPNDYVAQFDDQMRQHWARTVWDHIYREIRGGDLTTSSLSSFAADLYRSIRARNIDDLTTLAQRAREFNLPNLDDLLGRLLTDEEFLETANAFFASTEDIVAFLDADASVGALETRVDALVRLLSADSADQDWELVVAPTVTINPKASISAHELLLTAWQERLRLEAEAGHDIEVEADRLAITLARLDETARSTRLRSPLYSPALAEAFELSIRYASSEQVLSFFSNFFPMHDYSAERGEVDPTVGSRPLAAALARLWEMPNQAAVVDGFVASIDESADDRLLDVILTALTATIDGELGRDLNARTAALVDLAQSSRSRDKLERARGVFYLRMVEALSRRHKDILDVMERANLHLTLPQWIEEELDEELKVSLVSIWSSLAPRTLWIDDFPNISPQQLALTSPLTIDWRSPGPEQGTSEQYAWLKIDLKADERYYLSFSDIPVRYAVVSRNAEILWLNYAKPNETVALSDIPLVGHGEFYVRLQAQEPPQAQEALRFRDKVQLKTVQRIGDVADVDNRPMLDLNTPYQYTFMGGEREAWFEFATEDGKTYGVETFQLLDADTTIELFKDPNASSLVYDDDGGKEWLASYVEYTPDTADELALKVSNLQREGSGSFHIIIKEIGAP